jgi:hypothetical protein
LLVSLIQAAKLAGGGAAVGFSSPCWGLSCLARVMNLAASPRASSFGRPCKEETVESNVLVRKDSASF